MRTGPDGGTRLSAPGGGRDERDERGRERGGGMREGGETDRRERGLEGGELGGWREEEEGGGVLLHQMLQKRLIHKHEEDGDKTGPEPDQGDELPQVLHSSSSRFRDPPESVHPRTRERGDPPT